MPNYKYNNLPGMKINMLTVVELVGRDNHGAKLWKCRCDCGNYTILNTSNIVSGRIKSCGCINGYNFKTHGHSKERLHSIWKGMRKRCNNRKEPSYKHYGGRGIKVCDEWSDYMVFRKWALDSGYNDSLTIERIDVNKGYEPGNCEWITLEAQARNRRNTVKMSKVTVPEEIVKNIMKICEGRKQDGNRTDLHRASNPRRNSGTP